jgi:hypothetical protein
MATVRHTPQAEIDLETILEALQQNNRRLLNATPTRSMTRRSCSLNSPSLAVAARKSCPTFAAPLFSPTSSSTAS